MLNVLLTAARGLATSGLGVGFGASASGLSVGFGASAAAAAAAATVAAPPVSVVLGGGGVIAGLLVTGGVACLSAYLLLRPVKHSPALLLVVQQAEMTARNGEKDQNDEHEICGARQVDWPTTDQIEQALTTTGYSRDKIHFAVAGASGSGKSSLINAFRGLRNRDTEREAAPTGTNETTMTVGRYPDLSDLPPRQWTVWYDVPGAGTQSVPDWQYFNQQSLFIFDAIVVVFNDRFTLVDLGILRNCQALGIPSFIVRTKADVHIQNILEDKYDPMGGEGQQYYSKTDRLNCRNEFVKETKKAVAVELERAGLDPGQQVYVVSKAKLRSVVCAVTECLKRPKDLIDEEELYVNLLTAATMWRCDPEQ